MIDLKKRFLISFLVSVVVLSLVGVVAYGSIDRYIKSFNGGDTGSGINTDAIASQLTTQTDEHTNILLLGMDGSEDRTDTMIIMSYNRTDGKIYMASLPRDTKIEIDGSTQKLNAAHVYGGKELLISKIKEITGIEINYIAEVNFDGFKEIVDILGGVDFYVPQDMQYTDASQDLYIDLEEGMQHLDGNQSEQVVRFRHYMMGDLDRTNVQRDFMKALIQQKVNLTIIPKLPSLFSACSKYMDTNITLADIMKNVDAIKAFGDNDIVSLQVPLTTTDIDGLSYVLISEDACLDMFAKYMGGSGVTDPYMTYEEWLQANGYDNVNGEPFPTDSSDSDTDSSGSDYDSEDYE